MDRSTPFPRSSVEDLDTALLAEVLHRLLASRRAGPQPVDTGGWVALDVVCAAASEALHVRIDAERIVLVARTHQRFEVGSAGIRIVRRPTLPAVPDILFHATTEEGFEAARRHGVLESPRKRLWLSEDEAHAWRVAHRLHGSPRLVVVDAARARRSGVRFQRARQPGLFTATPVPARHLLNLRPGYAEQWSAGGLPIHRFDDGTVRVALIQVTRRSGTTWEVAKGKLEPGESPEDAAVREVQEEMGLASGLRLLRHVGDIRYGFLAPGGAPRLKTIFLYLMEPLDPHGPFAPATGEGIGAVRWFLPEDAARAVTHTSLQPLMWAAADLVARYGVAAADLS
jgi:8-oxo-dGTP pyrophosphatase MutT (NUDIX family)/RNA:NAD 2'-phosphotransferase (TPT1/KptA family)